MKKILSLFVLLFVNSLAALAQVFILNDNVFQGRMSEIKTMVLDSLTNEPVAFASVYVIPSKDTTITNFTLTDAKGEAKLDEVPFGRFLSEVQSRPLVCKRGSQDRRPHCPLLIESQGQLEYAGHQVYCEWHIYHQTRI